MDRDSSVGWVDDLQPGPAGETFPFKDHIIGSCGCDAAGQRNQQHIPDMFGVVAAPLGSTGGDPAGQHRATYNDYTIPAHHQWYAEDCRVDKIRVARWMKWKHNTPLILVRRYCTPLLMRCQSK